MKVGVSHRAFFDSIQEIWPEAELVKSYAQVGKYKLIVFTGGEDINPKLYGQTNKASFFSQARDDWEIPILKAALANKSVKIFGICRGHQLINAILGGILTQDILMEGYVSHKGRHELEGIKSGTLVGCYKGEKVNSLHHQGVIRQGRILYPTSSRDGVIESTEGPNIVSVQFHPEFMLGEEATTKFFETINKWVEGEIKEASAANFTIMPSTTTRTGIANFI